MAKLGIFDQLLGGDTAQTAVINQNADRLDHALEDLDRLRELVKRQTSEILQLRAMFMGVVTLLHEKGAFEEADLVRAIKEAQEELMPAPPPDPRAVDPYRGLAGDSSASPAETEAAKALLAAAQDHHFAKQFAEARVIYKQIVDEYGTTKQAAVARQQLENLKR